MVRVCEQSAGKTLCFVLIYYYARGRTAHPSRGAKLRIRRVLRRPKNREETVRMFAGSLEDVLNMKTKNEKQQQRNIVLYIIIYKIIIIILFI